jgi:hypothetical protein
MSKPKRDFANLTALINSGEADIETRRLTMVAPPPQLTETIAPVPRAGEVLPIERPERQAELARREAAAVQTENATTRPFVQKLSLQLTEETILALYSRQLAERAKHRKRADTTIGWVADSLLRQALGLPALEQTANRTL